MPVEITLQTILGGANSLVSGRPDPGSYSYTTLPTARIVFAVWLAARTDIATREKGNNGIEYRDKIDPWSALDPNLNV